LPGLGSGVVGGGFDPQAMIFAEILGVGLAGSFILLKRETLNQARDRTTEMAGLARDSSSQTFSDASMSAPISGAE